MTLLCDLDRLINMKKKTSSRHFKITKWFQGGRTIYYATLPKGKRIKKSCWTDQLSQWGENTDGGHNYGYSIEAKRVGRLPKDFKPCQILWFSKDFCS